MKINTVDSLKVYTLSEDYTGYDSLFWASFGISLLIHIKVGEGEKKILFDTASDAEPVLHNMKLFGISPESIDIIFLSHGHFDHTGGLAGILKEIKRKDIPIIAHPDIFNVCIISEPYLEPYRSRIYLNQGFSSDNSREKIEELGGKWYLVKDPFRLMAGVITTGEIAVEERVMYERNRKLPLLDLKSGKLSTSMMRDDVSLLINTKKGLVIITGCSHAGIVSITRKSIEITKIKEVYGIIGGFHLLNSSSKEIDRTIKDLENLGVRKIYSGHCTGLEAEYKLRKVFSTNFERLHCGKIICFNS